MTAIDQFYNWNTLPREVVMEGLERCAFRGDDTLCVMNWISPGLRLPVHSHPFEQLVFILEGRANFRLGARLLELGPGSMVRVPPDVPHMLDVVGSETVLNLDVFNPIREDYRHLVEYQAGAFEKKFMTQSGDVSDRSRSSNPHFSLLRLSNGYWDRLDGREATPASEIFEPEAEFRIGALRLNGSDAIEQFLVRRNTDNPDRVTRHVCTNFDATVRGDEAWVKSVVTVYAGVGKLPLASADPTTIADIEDHCVRGADGRWRYARRSMEVIFISEGAGQFLTKAPAQA